MGDYTFHIKDYRIIKEADFTPDGITLVYAKNGSGKSTLLKALVSLLSNRHSEDNFRHGKNTYSISAKVGENRLTYTRTGNGTQLMFNDEIPRSKFGQGPMSQIEPRFPLKRIDYLENYFFPNFSFQNNVPVFNDIAVADLFSSLFTDVARLSERVTGCRNECVNTARVKNDSQINSDLLKEKVSEASKAVAQIKLNNPDLDDKYKYLGGLARKREEQVNFLAEFSDISAQCSDSNKRVLVALYNDAQPFFSDLVFINNLKGVLGQLERAKAELGVARTEYSVLAGSFPLDVYNLVSGVRQISTVQASLTSIHVERDALPDFSDDLISSGVTLISLVKTLDGVQLELNELPVVSDTLLSEVRALSNLEIELYQVRLELQDVDISYSDIMKDLKEFPCERYLSGVCPFQEQIRL